MTDRQSNGKPVEEMRKSLRTCGLLGFSRCLTVSLSKVATTHAASAVSGQRRAKCSIGNLARGQTVSDSVGRSERYLNAR